MNTTKNLPDGIIIPGPTAPFNFTTEHFDPDSYLWKSNDSIYTSLIITKPPSSGHFRALVKNILTAGYTVKVPSPLGRMKDILLKNNYTQTFEDTEIGPCEVWVLKPENQKNF